MKNFTEIEFHHNNILSSKQEEFGKNKPIANLQIHENFLPSIIYMDKIFPFPPYFATEKEHPYSLIENYQYWQIQRRIFFIKSIEIITSWFNEADDYFEISEVATYLTNYLTFSITVSKSLIELMLRVEDICKSLVAHVGKSKIANIDFYAMSQILPLDYIHMHYVHTQSEELNYTFDKNALVINVNDENHREIVEEYTNLLYSIVDNYMEQENSVNEEEIDIDEEEIDEEEIDQEEIYDYIVDQFGDEEFQQEIADQWEYDPDNPDPEHFS